MGRRSFDAITKNKKTVQIKANHSSKQIGFRGKADLMLVLKIDENGDYKEIYYGDFKTVVNVSNNSYRDNKLTIGVTKLRKLQDELVYKYLLNPKKFSKNLKKYFP